MTGKAPARSIATLSAAVLLWYLVTYVLLPVPAVRSGLDESWRAFLTWAFQHGRQFGTEVIFTYGPWGFLLEPRGTFNDYPWQIVGRLVFALAVSTGIALLGVSWIHSAAQRWLWAAALVILAEPSALIPILLFFGTTSSMAESRWKKPALFLIAFAAGLAACTKFSNLLLVASLMPVMLTRKGLAPIVPTTVASFVLFWLAAGQSLINVPAFLSNSLEISKGYASAMVLGRPFLETWLGLSICGLPLVSYASRTWLPVTVERLMRIGWLAACQLLLFRHALIRNDSPHWFMAFISVGIPIGILLIAFPPPASKSSRMHWQPAYGAFLAVVLAITLWISLETVMDRAAIFRESLRLYPEYGRTVPPPYVAPPGAESVDVFPNELSYAIKMGLPIRNRPEIQSCTAYTKRLCEANAAFLESQEAPQLIYFQSAPIDSRYPTMEDSLAWRSLLTHYFPSGVADEHLVLKRRARPAGYELRPIFERSFRTEEAVEIPEVSGGLIWAELEVQQTPLGRSLDLLYRSEKMTLRLATTRRSLSFTLLNETTGGGFLLSPYVDSAAAMLDVYQPQSDRFSAEAVRRLLVHSGRVAALGFSRTMKLRVYELIMNAPTSDTPAWPIRELSRTMRSDRPVNSVPFAPTLQLKSGEARLMVGSSSSGWIPQPPGDRLRVRYGTQLKGAACSGALSFRILQASGDTGERRLLWEAPSQFETGKERSEETTVKLPHATGQQRLYFETQSEERSCGAEGAYWADLRLEP